MICFVARCNSSTAKKEKRLSCMNTATLMASSGNLLCFYLVANFCPLYKNLIISSANVFYCFSQWCRFFSKLFQNDSSSTLCSRGFMSFVGILPLLHGRRVIDNLSRGKEAPLIVSISLMSRSESSWRFVTSCSRISGEICAVKEAVCCTPQGKLGLGF